jgi:hypothetical protein
MVSMYPKLQESRKFRLRQEAEEWAKKKKEEYKIAEMSVKIDIKFMNDTKEWKAELYVRTEY